MDNLGEVFKKAREDKGLTIKDVSIQTNIGSKFIKAIENNDFSVFPGEAYTVGFIRNYAEFLKIDPEEVIRLFYTNQIAESETPIEELVAPTKPKLNPIPIILIVVVIIAIITSIFFLVNRKRNNNTLNTQNFETTTNNTQTQTNNAQENQINLSQLPIYSKKVVGDKIFIKIKNKTLKIEIKKIDEKFVHVAFSSVGDEDFLMNMRRTFKIEIKKQLKFDIERNREYDFSLGVETIPSPAQAQIYIRKMEDPYENERYYDYFIYQAPDQATLTQLQQRNQNTQQSDNTDNQSSETSQQNTNTQNNQPNTQTQASNQKVKLNLILTNNMDRDSVIYIWIKKDTTPEIKTIKLAKNQTIKVEAKNKISLDTNNLYGLKVMINGKLIKTKNIANDGGVGKLRFWINKSPSGKTEIKWEINR